MTARTRPGSRPRPSSARRSYGAQTGRMPVATPKELRKRLDVTGRHAADQGDILNLV